MKSIFFMLMSSLLSGVAYAHPPHSSDLTLTKEVQESFDLPKSGTVDLRSNYGTITLEHWEEQTVWIKAVVTATGKDAESAQKSLDRVTFLFDLSGIYLHVETEFDKKASKVKGLLRNVADFSKGLVGDGNLKIDYLIKMPHNLTLMIDHSNGDVVLPNTDIPLQVKLNDGTFRSEKLGKTSKFDFSGVNATIKDAEEAIMQLKSSEVTVVNAHKLDLHSSLVGSKIMLTKVEELYLDLQNDQLEAEEVGTIVGKSSISRLSITKLNKSMSFDQNFGSLKIKEVSAEVTGLKLNAKNADVEIWLPRKGEFTVDVRGNDNKITLPKWENLDKTFVDANKNEVKYTLGNIEESTARHLQVSLSGGSLKVAEL